MPTTVHFTGRHRCDGRRGHFAKEEDAVESIQKRLTRERPPRVKITYDVETLGSAVKTELPFVMGIIADLSGDRTCDRVKAFGAGSKIPEYEERDFVFITRDSFTKVMASFTPMAKVKLLDSAGGDGCEIAFRKMDDFTPDALVQNVPALRTLLDARSVCRDCRSALDADSGLLNGVTKYLQSDPPEKFDEKKFKECFTDGNAVVSKYPYIMGYLENTANRKALVEYMEENGAAYLKTFLDKGRESDLDAGSPFLEKLTKGLKDYATKEKEAKAKFDKLFEVTAGGVPSIKHKNLKAHLENPENRKAFVKCVDDGTGVAHLKPLLDKEGGNDKDLDADSSFLIDLTKGLKDYATKEKAAKDEFDALFQTTDGKSDSILHEKLKAHLNSDENMDRLLDNLKNANILAAFACLIAKKDGAIGENVDAILHDNNVQALEAAWRGLFYLVSNTETGEFLKLRVLNASRLEVEKDLSRASNFDQSKLFKKVYEETYGTLGGEPYSCLLFAHEFDHGDVDFLRGLMQIASAAHAPLIAAAAPSILGLDSFTTLSNPSNLYDIISRVDHTAWNSLRKDFDARYLNFVLPRVLMRMPYTEKKVESFLYNESLGADAANPDHGKYLWGNAAFFLAQRITNAYALYRWTAAIRGVEGGGVVENLPAHTYPRASGDDVIKIPTETAITDRREKELSDLGFIALCYRVNTDKAAFLGAQSLHRPDEYENPEATSNSRLSARLPYLLNASRFAHYIKVKMRDKVGSFLDRESVEIYLNNWISGYVLLTDAASQEIKAQYPLREAQVVVEEVEGSPGSYTAVIHLRPHFQMEELLVSLRLVAKLPEPGAFAVPQPVS